MLTQDQFLFHFGGKLYSEYKTYYKPVNTDLVIDADLYHRIITEDITVACLVADKNNSSNYLVFDIDSTQETETTLDVAGKLSDYLKSRNINTSIVYSGKKGYHIYVFLHSNLSLFTLNSLAKLLISDFEYDKEFINIEIFPKQTYTSFKDENYGNHLKLPITVHPLTKVRAEFLTPYVINPSSVLTSLQTGIFVTSGIPEVVTTLSSIFKDGNRHSVTMAVAGFFKVSGIEKWVTEDIFDRLITINGGEKQDVFSVINSTYAKNGKVAGLNYCEDITQNVQNVLYNFIYATKPTFKVRDQIINVRTSKGPSFLKSERIAQIILGYINSEYTLYNDGSYIYIVNAGLIITDKDSSLARFLHLLGLNKEEGFVKQIVSSLVTSIMLSSIYIDIKPFSKYTGDVLIYNSSSTAIKISSEEIKEVEINYPILDNTAFFLREPINGEGYFTKILKTFGLSETDREIVIAWTVAQFFLQRMNTKPVLLIKGLPGSGKTSLANFLLQIVEKMGSKSVAIGKGKDSLISSLASHKMLVLDNLEHIDPNTTDFINSILTGTQIELRKLYTTNDKVTINVECSLCITSAYDSFDHDGALITRTVEVVVPKRTKNAVESEFVRFINTNYDQIMSEMCYMIQKTIQGLEKVYDVTTQLRMSDFVILTKAMQKAGVVKNDLEVIVYNKQIKLRSNTAIFRLFLDTVGKEYNKPFDPTDILIAFASKAKRYGVTNINILNIERRLLSTGMFEKNGKHLHLAFNDSIV